MKSVAFYDRDNNLIAEYGLVSLPVREAEIIKNSVKWFDDPEPCFIHRSAVVKRLLAGFEEYLESLEGEGRRELPLEQLPRDCDIFDLPANAHRLVIRD